MKALAISVSSSRDQRPRCGVSSSGTRRTRFPALAVLLSSFLSLVPPAAARAQTSTGTLYGSVSDTSGGRLARVDIVAASEDTGAVVVAQTDARGQYRLPQLPPGQYRVTATLPGFKTVTWPAVPVAVQEQLRLDFTLGVGPVTETVQVSAVPVPLGGAVGSLGRVVDTARIAALPLDTRNIYTLVNLTPGVSGEIGQVHSRVLYSVNGARAGMMDTVFDGASASFPTVNGFHGVSVFPSVDAVQEFQVQAGNYAAEFGRSLGSVLNMVSKSGSNAFRGTAFDLYRNSRFDENNFFNKRRNLPLPSFSRSQMGGMASGPLQRGRTFFMASFEALRANSFRELLNTVPTALERLGDFSQTRSTNGQPIVIYDPLSTVPNAAGTGYVRSPFPGNRIPASRMDPVALNLLRYYPAPNQPGDPLTGRNNYYASGVARVNTDNLDIRVDRVVGDGGRLFGRYSYRDSLDAPPELFPHEIVAAQGRVVQQDHGQNAVIDYSSRLGRRTLVTARLGFARTHFNFANQSLGFTMASLGLPAAIDAAADRPIFPGVAVNDTIPLGGGDHRDSGFNSYTLGVSVSRTHRSHFLKAGYEGRLFRIDVWEARSASFSFPRQFTQGPNPLAATTTGGHGLASLLLGAGRQGSLYQNWKNVASQSLYSAWYLQDDWRVRDRLTLALGVRYDFDAPRTERYDRMSWFDPDVRSPLADVTGLTSLRGGLEFVGVDGHPRTQYDGDWNNIAPRLGVAYRVTDKTVVRAGIGRFFGPSSMAAQGTVGPYGFRVETPWVTTLDGLTPLNYLRNPYPDGFRPVPGSADGLLTGIGGNIEGPFRDTKTANEWQWHATIARELPGSVLVEASYVGARGRDLALGTESGYLINQLDTKYLALGSALNELVPNPFYPYVKTGILAQPTVARGQLLRPYPQFGDIVPLFASGARSQYDALQLTGGRRFANGVAVDGSFVGAKSTDWGQNYQNSYDPAGANSLSASHVPYRVVMSGIYQLPIGRGRAFGGSLSPALEALVGGWQVNGIWTLQAGPTLSVTASNTAGLFGAVGRPNWNGQDASIDAADVDKLDRWFDTSAFSQPVPFTLGNAPERIPGLRADRLNNVDLSIFKELHVAPALRVQLRVEAFNVFNDVQFAVPNMSVNAAAFGQVTAQANAPRQLQLGVKALW